MITITINYNVGIKKPELYVDLLIAPSVAKGFN